MRAAAEQMPLALGAVSESASDWDLVLAWFRRAIDVIGHKEVAYRLDIAPSNLSDAINERERKDVKGRWIATVLRMAPPPSCRSTSSCCAPRTASTRPSGARCSRPTRRSASCAPSSPSSRPAS